MPVIAEPTPRPLAGCLSIEAEEHRPADDWFLSLRHAQIPFHASDRLVILQGHRLVCRLGLYAAIERVLTGESVLYVDGANTFDPFVIGRLARTHRMQPRRALSMIHVARAFTGHQTERLVSDCLGSALQRYLAKTVILSGLLETVYDGTAHDQEASRSFGRIADSIFSLTRQGYRVVCLCPSAPLVTAARRRSLKQLCAMANRVIDVQEAFGVVRLEEERPHGGPRWEVAKTALDLQ